MTPLIGFVFGLKDFFIDSFESQGSANAAVGDERATIAGLGDGGAPGPTLAEGTAMTAGATALYDGRQMGGRHGLAMCICGTSTHTATVD